MALVIKNLPVNAGDIRDTGLIPGLGRPPWRKAWQPTPVYLPGESLGQGILVGYSAWATKSWTRLKWLSTLLSIITKLHVRPTEFIRLRAESLYSSANIWNIIIMRFAMTKNVANNLNVHQYSSLGSDIYM